DSPAQSVAIEHHEAVFESSDGIVGEELPLDALFPGRDMSDLTHSDAGQFFPVFLATCFVNSHLARHLPQFERGDSACTVGPGRNGDVYRAHYFLSFYGGVKLSALASLLDRSIDIRSQREESSAFTSLFKENVAVCPSVREVPRSRFTSSVREAFLRLHEAFRPVDGLALLRRALGDPSSSLFLVARAPLLSPEPRLLVDQTNGHTPIIHRIGAHNLQSPSLPAGAVTTRPQPLGLVPVREAQARLVHRNIGNGRPALLRG